MKAIPKNQFLIMVQNTFEKEVFADDIEKMFNQFGDDWFYDASEGGWEKTVDRGLYRAKEFNT